jgi:hypothetical protein
MTEETIGFANGHFEGVGGVEGRWGELFLAGEEGKAKVEEGCA